MQAEFPEDVLLGPDVNVVVKVEPEHEQPVTNGALVDPT